MTDKTKLLYSKAVGKIQDSCRFHSRRILNTPEGKKLSLSSLATKTSTFAVLDLLVELGLVELDRSAQANIERDCKGLKIDPARAPISAPKPEPKAQKKARKRKTKAQAEEKALKGAVTEMAAKLGFEVQLNADADLELFRKGEPMTVAELEALPLGAIVWFKCYVDGKGLRADSCYRIDRFLEDEGVKGYFLDDGSMGAAEFYPSDVSGNPLKPNEPAINEEYGLYEVFHATPISKEAYEFNKAQRARIQAELDELD